MQDLKEKIVSAWVARANMELEKSFQLLTALKQELGIPSQLTEGSVLNYGENTDQVLSVLVLQSSLTSVLQRISDGEKLLSRLEAEAHQRGLLNNFYLSYERGRLLFQQGDFSEALECFLRAEILAEREIEKLWAAINCYFCLRNLALPTDTARAKVFSLVDMTEGKYPLDTVRSQMRFTELQDHFRDGEFAKAIEMDKASEGVSQVTYMSVLLQSLPYYSGFKATPERLQSFTLEKPRLLFKSYRLRTLQGILHPDDHQVAKPTEQIDRLYLWVWRWLYDPSAFSAEKITSTIRGIDFPSIIHRLTAEDRQLLRNVLSWISFFDPASEPRMRTTVSLLTSGPQGDFPLLRFEYLMSQYFTALRDRKSLEAKDYLVALKGHPIWDSKEVEFRSLIDEVENPKSKKGRLSNLAQTLRRIIDRRSGDANLEIDPRLGRIVDNATGKALISEPMARAFDLLNKSPVVSCESFVEACLGYPRYDSMIHNARVFDLLSRMRKISAPQLQFRFKGGKVFAEGSWEGIEIRESMEVPRFVVAEVTMVEKTAMRFRKATTQGKNLPPHWEGQLTRKDLEQQLGCPRSTVNRMLAQWVESGLIGKVGRARSTKYFPITQSVLGGSR